MLGFSPIATSPIAGLSGGGYGSLALGVFTLVGNDFLRAFSQTIDLTTFAFTGFTVVPGKDLAYASFILTGIDGQLGNRSVDVGSFALVGTEVVLVLTAYPFWAAETALVPTWTPEAGL